MAEGEAAPTKGKGTFVAFRYRNFRLMWSASLLSSSGTWLQNVAVPFVIYRITESGFWLGFTGFLSYLPMVLTGPWAGSHRRPLPPPHRAARHRHGCSSSSPWCWPWPGPPTCAASP